MSKWLPVSDPLPYQTKAFQQIIDFYLINCPVSFKESGKGKLAKTKRVSVKGKTFQQRGITGSQLTKLLSQMKSSCSVVIETTPSGFVEARIAILDKDNIEKKDKNFEVLVYSLHSSAGTTQSIFYYIRNALAHGSFSVVSTTKGRVYWFENAKDGNVKGRFRLRESTLLKWIDLVEHFNNANKTVVK